LNDEYDHESFEVRYGDDNKKFWKKPTRYLMDWFLLYRMVNDDRSSCETVKDLVPLPHEENHFYFSSRYEMHGTLEPNKLRTKDNPPIRIVLRDMKMWTIDGRDLERGILVHTIDALYHLNCPRETLLTVNEGVADLHQDALDSTMNHVHMPSRAMCGLVYNILDIFAQEASSTKYNLTEKTPEQLYTLLTPSDEQLKQYPEIPEVPFDMVLLRRYPNFVKERILQCLPLMERKCTFVEGLRAMAKNYKKAIRNKDLWALQTLKYENFAVAAEKCSGRDPSGKRLKGAPKCNPIKVLYLERESDLTTSVKEEEET
jgi:hypothetical protein